MGSPAASRSAIFACAMSRATTSGPLSESRVATGYLVSSARISLIGRFRSIRTTSSPSSSSVASGRYWAGSVSSRSRYTPSGVILASACRSAEHDTAMATGQEAPCRGSRITRTSWQKYLPPNCAPMPIFRVISRTSASSPVSRKPRPPCDPWSGVCPGTGRTRTWLFSAYSALVPPTTMARWYGGQAAGPASGSSLPGTHAAPRGSAPSWSAGRGRTCWPTRLPWP